MIKFKEWLKSRDNELSEEFAQDEGLKSTLNWMGKKAAPAIVAGSSLFGGGMANAPTPNLDPHQQMMQQHQQDMGQHQLAMKGINASLDKTGSFLDNQEDEENAAEDDEIRKSGYDDDDDEGFTQRRLDRKKELRKINGKPSQRAASKADMYDTEMDLDSRDRHSFNHDAAASGDVGKWRASKEAEDITNKTNANSTLEKLLKNRK